VIIKYKISTFIYFDLFPIYSLIFHFVFLYFSFSSLFLTSFVYNCRALSIVVVNMNNLIPHLGRLSLSEGPKCFRMLDTFGIPVLYIFKMHKHP
jgi:hypothetical protein